MNKSYLVTSSQWDNGTFLEFRTEAGATKRLHSLWDTGTDACLIIVGPNFYLLDDGNQQRQVYDWLEVEAALKAMGHQAA